MKETSTKARLSAASVALSVTFAIIWSMSGYAYSSPEATSQKTGTVELRLLCPASKPRQIE